jgi:hypothetical protein
METASPISSHLIHLIEIITIVVIHPYDDSWVKEVPDCRIVWDDLGESTYNAFFSDAYSCILFELLCITLKNLGKNHPLAYGVGLHNPQPMKRFISLKNPSYNRKVYLLLSPTVQSCIEIRADTLIYYGWLTNVFPHVIQPHR